MDNYPFVFIYPDVFFRRIGCPYPIRHAVHLDAIAEMEGVLTLAIKAMEQHLVFHQDIDSSDISVQCLIIFRKGYAVREVPISFSKGIDPQLLTFRYPHARVLEGEYVVVVDHRLRDGKRGI